MSEQKRDPKFYVVGGTVQPGRDCYLQRFADADLFQRISDGEYCHVLAQPQAGKTSLAASTAARLRAQGSAVALVDLTRTSSEDPSENAGRWYYSIVYRIARDLRLKADLQKWWAERGGLTNLQRLREFFQEIVLQEADAPVTIFFDRLEAIRNESLAKDLFAAVRACYDARATVPEFNRLVFVMLGSAAADELVSELQGSPFEISRAIQLEDFSPQETAGLIAGLGEQNLDAEAVIQRVWSWTRGHPYLSQKVFRGLARRKDEVIDAKLVDELVHKQFNSPTTLHDEPHVSAIAERLSRPGSGRSARLNLYGRLRKGVEVMSDPRSEAQHELLMAGVLDIRPAGELRVRNEIYAMVFSTHWVNQSLPFGGRGLFMAVAAMIFVVALPIWYSEYLPRPYVRALNSADQDFQLAEDAYSSLSLIPGYGTSADRLFQNFLVRSSRNVDSLADVMRINSRLALLPESEGLSAELLAAYWERLAVRNMHQGDRDGALMAALEALQTPGELRRRLAGELIGDDYRRLWASLRTRAPVTAIAADRQNNLLTLLDQQNHIDIWRLGSDAPEHLVSTRLIAEERLQLEQRRSFADLPAQPELVVALAHPEPGQLQVTLRSPAGQEGTLMLDQAQIGDHDLYRFPFASYAQLRQLLQGPRNGNWVLVLTNLQRGEPVELTGWSIVASGSAATFSGSPSPLPLPEPRASVNATARLSDDGRLALSWPVGRDTPGPVLVWDLLDNAIVARLPRGADMRDARFVMQGERVLIIGAQNVEIWDSASGRKLGQFRPDAPGRPRLTLSAGGRYAAVPVLRDDTGPAIAVWDLATARRKQLQPVVAATALAVDATGSYLAVGGRDSRVRVWSLKDGALLQEFAGTAPARSLSFAPSGSWLAGDDLSNTFRLWDVTVGGAPLIQRAGSSPWRSSFAADAGRLIAGSADRSYEVYALPEGRRSAVGLRHTSALGGTASTSVEPLLLAGLGFAVTLAGGNDVKVWELPAAIAAKVPARSLSGQVRAALSADGRRIAAGGYTDKLRIYVPDAPGEVLLKPRQEDGEQDSAVVLCLAFTADQRMLAAGGMDGAIRIWETQRGTMLDVQIVHADGPVHDLMFSGDGQLLFSASRREALVTRLSTGETLARLRIQANNPSLAYAAEVGQLFIAGDAAGVTRWNWRDGISSAVVEAGRDITRAAVSASGRRLVTANRSGLLTVWDTDRGLPLQQSLEAAAKVDHLWLVDEGRHLIVQAGHWVHSMKVLPDGLAAQSTRLFENSPVALQPDDRGRELLVLSPAAGSPVFQRVTVSEPAAAPVQGDPTAVREDWHRRLAMTLDADGRPVAVLPQSPGSP